MIFLVLIQIFELTEIRKHGKEFWLSKYSFGDTPPKINGSNLKMDALEDDVHIFSFSRGPVFSGSMLITGVIKYLICLGWILREFPDKKCIVWLGNIMTPLNYSKAKQQPCEDKISTTIPRRFNSTAKNSNNKQHVLLLLYIKSGTLTFFCNFLGV